MTPTEALQLLDAATISRDVKSRVNPSFSCGQVFDIVRDGIIDIQARIAARPLDHIMEKRVHQVIRNQRKPDF